MDIRSVAPPRPAPALTGAWRFTAAPLDVAVPQIRHAVRDLLRRQQAPLSADLLHGVLLIVSELVTNAVRHAALLTPVIGVEVRLEPGWVRLAVEDGHPYRPTALRVAPEQETTGGRGLLLVRATAESAGGDCGVEPTADGGKRTWAALPLDPARP
ncbi:ATP-binding protein [Streptomyces sp. B6B3]|uniref:ATP-binding protein n=1 Tax=Streptomyces sp. B6B3 TaxID=3153570 RepID=UPI00325DDCD9